MKSVSIKPELLRWARERAGRTADSLSDRFPKYLDWERGEKRPTLKQLESLAQTLFVPIGYLFLSEPPIERLPIPDLRTVGSRILRSPSPDLLDTIYVCQRRQAWFQEFAQSVRLPACDFVGTATTRDPIIETARAIRERLRFDADARQAFPTWTHALRHFISQAESAGVLVMVSGVVESNNRRKLDPEEFRGFAISDPVAPLVFINGADAKSAQMFTLAHELAHLWLGESAISDIPSVGNSGHKIETWCNAVAAELLAPERALRDILAGKPLDEIERLARHFKVSALVIIRRLYDLRLITKDEYSSAYQREMQRSRTKSSSGGDFYRTQEARASRRFLHALVVSVLEGHTLYRDAFQLLGIKKEKTFREFGIRLGVIA
ncbi:MAG: XRE family transcriptional regulator [Planctomycetota bacterium]